MLKLKLQYFGHLMERTDLLEKTLMLGKIEGRRRRGWQRMKRLDGIPNSWVWVNSGSWWWTGKPGMLQSMASQRVGHDWATELNWTKRAGIEETGKNFMVEWTFRRKGNSYPVFFSKFFHSMANLDPFQETEEGRALRMLPPWRYSFCLNISKVELFLQVCSSTLKNITVWESLGFVFVLMLAQKEKNLLLKFSWPGEEGARGWKINAWLWKEYLGECYFFLFYTK